MTADGTQPPIRYFIDSVKAFGLSRSLMTSLDLDLFPRLSRGEMTRHEIVSEFNLQPDLTDAFLQVLLAGGFLELREGRYKLTESSGSVLENYVNIKSWNEEMKRCFFFLEDFTNLLQNPSPRGRRAPDEFFALRMPDHVPARERPHVFSQSMDDSAGEIVERILSGWDFSKYRTVLDMGGSYARLAIRLAQTYPSLSVTIVDLPEVCRGAQAKIGAAGLSSRITCFGADFFRGPFPAEADAVVFSRVLNDWGDAEVKHLLRCAHDMLGKSKGEVIIVEGIDIDETAPQLGSAVTGLMNALLGGRRRTIRDYFKMLTDAGFIDPRSLDLNWGMFRLITAKRG